MFQAWSRWDAFRVIAIAIAIALCSMIGLPVTYAEESFASRLDPFGHGRKPAVSATPTAGDAVVANPAPETSKKPRKKDRGAPVNEVAPAVEAAAPPDDEAEPAKTAKGILEASAEAPWTAERTIALLTERAMAHGSDPYEVLAVARCETGWTFMPWRENGYLLRGSLGEVGVGQWLPPVERNHWGRTPHYREYGYHIEVGYISGDPEAIWWDADALAWSMGPAAPWGFRQGWSCWRIRGPWWYV